MAVLKQTSPTALPAAPIPSPSITVPSARTRTAVGRGGDQGGGAAVVMRSSRVVRLQAAGKRSPPMAVFETLADLRPVFGQSQSLAGSVAWHRPTRSAADRSSRSGSCVISRPNSSRWLLVLRCRTMTVTDLAQSWCTGADPRGTPRDGQTGAQAMDWRKFSLLRGRAFNGQAGLAGVAASVYIGPRAKGVS